MVFAVPATAAMNKKSATIRVGGTVRLKVKGKGKTAGWTSSDPKVASVNKHGKVKGKTPGKAVIKAKVGKKVYTCKLTVRAGRSSKGAKAAVKGSGINPGAVIAGSPDEETLSGSPDNLGAAIAEKAKQYIGNPYSWGGTSLEHGADADGFCYAVFARSGIQLMRVADDQMKGPSEAYVKLGYEKGYVVKDKDLMPGDLIFYGNTSYANHVGLYIGNKKIFHAANAKKGITISDIDFVKTRVRDYNMRYWDRNREMSS